MRFNFLFSIASFFCLINFSNSIARQLEFAEVFSDSFLVPLLSLENGNWQSFSCQSYEDCEYEPLTSNWSLKSRSLDVIPIKIHGKLSAKEFSYPGNYRVGYPILFLEKEVDNSKKRRGIASTSEIEISFFKRYDFRYDALAKINSVVLETITSANKKAYKDKLQEFKTNPDRYNSFGSLEFKNEFLSENFNINFISESIFEGDTYYQYETTIVLGERFETNACIVGHGWVILDDREYAKSITQDFSINFCTERKASNGYFPKAIFELNGETYIIGATTDWDGSTTNLIILGDSVNYQLNKPYFGY